MLFMYCEWQEMLLAMLVVGISETSAKKNTRHLI
ncbi:hypothetical protein SLEP1_g12211 [Rubroshorea leprosula]|uniref:Uncharacterized protein n=1 Tax=Rubroshorea leprosula TaxID=152421 RepID=A0AAV5IMG3_9ROSI|nr:hypothetical protein SLEP1_g12211 [Rubroshorea leprosula]